jgi:basic amino acid/polyamine antiporter, APA family
MQLKPVLGPVQLVFYSVGVIIGAGVYSVIGAAAGLAGDNLWISFLAGAVIALLTGLSYAEMTTSFPTAGAEYVYVRRAFPRAPWASFAVGWIILFGGAATATTVAVAFGGYLRSFVDVPIMASAFMLLAACTLVAIWGMRESSWLNIVFTTIEVSGLLLVVAAGFTKPQIAQPLLSPDIQPGIMAATAILFFVYLGFEEVANLAEEVREPTRDMPPAILWSIGVTTVLYILVSLAAVALVSPSELAASEAPLALAVERVWPGAGGLLSGIALFATANTVLITLIAISRLAFSMARDGESPVVMARLAPKRGTPWIASLITFVLSVVLLPIGDIAILAGLSSFAALLAFFAVNVALIALRYRHPDHKRPFRVPVNIGRLPVLPVLAIASILFLLAYFDWKIHVAGGVAIALTGVAYLGRNFLSR